MVRIGDMLLSLSACPPEAIEEALQNQRIFGARLGTNLLEMGAVDEQRLADALARLYRLPVLSGEIAADRSALRLVPRRLVELHDLVPYAIDGNKLRVVVCDPRNTPAIDEIAFATGKRVEAMVAPEARVWSLMRSHYGIERGMRAIDGERRRWAPRLYPTRRGVVEPIAATVWTPRGTGAQQGSGLMSAMYLTLARAPRSRARDASTPTTPRGR